MQTLIEAWKKADKQNVKDTILEHLFSKYTEEDLLTQSSDSELLFLVFCKNPTDKLFFRLLLDGKLYAVKKILLASYVLDYRIENNNNTLFDLGTPEENYVINNIYYMLRCLANNWRYDTYIKFCGIFAEMFAKYFEDPITTTLQEFHADLGLTYMHSGTAIKMIQDSIISKEDCKEAEIIENSNTKVSNDDTKKA